MNSESGFPVISICIPTFNRASLLERTLDSIVKERVFLETNDFEVVISDNCSTDNTWAIIDCFQDRYPTKIRAFRRSETVSAEANIHFVMSMGLGSYLKAHNDHLMFRGGSLGEMLKIVRAVFSEKPVIFFTNGSMRRDAQIEALGTVNDFVRRVSFYSTWLGGFGMWRQEFEIFPDFLRFESFRLVIPDVLLRLLAIGKRAIVVYEAFFVGSHVKNKGGYNIAEVFGRNYLHILKEYLRSGVLDKAVFEEEKKFVLLNHIIPYYFGDNGFDKTGFFQYTTDYVADDYYYNAIESLALGSKMAPGPGEAPVDYKAQVAALWRTLNPHNETFITRNFGPFDFDRIKVGRRTYGGLALFYFQSPDERLNIGSFVSIGEDVKFLLGGNHRIDGFSSFPFEAKYFGLHEATTKGAINVHDDVWIGFDSTILSGVTIGQGAVIAAGSIVTKDVPPYCVVGGNPAKIIRFRFSGEVIEKLLKIDYSRISDELIVRNRSILYDAISRDNVDSFLELFEA